MVSGILSRKHFKTNTLTHKHTLPMSKSELNLSINAKSVTISGNNGRLVTIDAEGVEISDLLDHLEIADIVKHFSDDKIMDEIGVDRVQEYFDLI
jgi:hypothetical protein